MSLRARFPLRAVRTELSLLIVVERRDKTPRMKKVLALSLFAVIAVCGPAAWYTWPRGHALSERDLTFASLQRATLRDVVSAIGLIEPREIVYVSSEMPGTVTRLLAGANDVVPEGTELGQLDDQKTALKVEEARTGLALADAAVAQARAAVSQAKASQDAAQLHLKVQEDLSSKGGFRSDRDQAEAQLRAAAAGVESAQAGMLMANAKFQAARTQMQGAELAHKLTRIKVPEPGLPSAARREFLILERKVQEGQLVGPQSGPLFVLAGSLQSVEVHAQVAEGDISKVHRGLPAVFTVSGYDDQDVEFRGTVKEIRPLATNVKGAVYYATIIDVANQKDPVTGEWRLRPGMTVSLDIVRREHKNVWRVPTAALNFKLEDAFLSDAARIRVAEWKARSDAADWQTLWVWDTETERATPCFVRIGGTGSHGEPGLKDSEGNEVLEWETGKEPSPDNPPRYIIGAPPAQAPGFFDQPAPFKVS
jgi:multidrug efflux pump subunit AcrA (membrane-fusion protein)